MTRLLKWLGALLGQILKAVLPELVREVRRPQNPEMHGGDPGLQTDIERDMEEQLRCGGSG